MERSEEKIEIKWKEGPRDGKVISIENCPLFRELYSFEPPVTSPFILKTRRTILNCASSIRKTVVE
jgi:hypothetical protein